MSSLLLVLALLCQSVEDPNEMALTWDDSVLITADLGITFFQDPSLVSVTLEDGEMTVVYRQSPSFQYAMWCPHDPDCNTPPDTIWREIYKAKNGEIVLDRKEYGHHIKPYRVHEQIVWPEPGESDAEFRCRMTAQQMGSTKWSVKDGTCSVTYEEEEEQWEE